MENIQVTIKREYFGTTADYQVEFTPDAVSLEGSFHKPLLGILRKHDMVKLPGGTRFVSGEDTVVWRTKSGDYENAAKIAEEVQRAVSYGMTRYFEFAAMIAVHADLEKWEEDRRDGKA